MNFRKTSKHKWKPQENQRKANEHQKTKRWKPKEIQRMKGPKNIYDSH